MRIFRTILILSGVTAFMPAPPEDSTQNTAAAETQATGGLLSSATMAFADMAGFCSRQPDVCRTAGYMAGRLEAKAKYSVRLIYEWAAESSSEPQVSPLPDQADATDPMTTGSTRSLMADAAPAAGQSTLKIEDLIPEWRGPLPRKKKG